MNFIETTFFFVYCAWVKLKVFGNKTCLQHYVPGEIQGEATSFISVGLISGCIKVIVIAAHLLRKLVPAVSQSELSKTYGAYVL